VDARAAALRPDAPLARLFAEHVTDLQRRYEAALAACALDAVAIHSGALKKRTDFDDQYWPLRPTPHFQHWIPLAEADCALVVRAGKRPTLVWPRVTSFWEQPPPPPGDDLLASFDVVRPASADAVAEHIPAGAAFVGEDRACAAAWKIEGERVAPTDLLARLDQLRVVKTAYEVATLAEANALAARGHEALRKAFVDGGRSELELHLLFLQTTQQDDAEAPYKNIVAMGRNAAVLHHVSYVKRPSGAAAESLLVDAGATVRGYCSDVTRTWVKGSGAAGSAFAGLLGEVEAMQQRLCATVTIGRPYEELHEDTHRQVGDILRKVGVVKGTSTEPVAKDVTRAFFPHGLGHSLGLQCHDVGCALIKPKPDNPFLRNTTVVAEGQVFTIEPGVYFIDRLLAELRQGPHGGSIDWALVDALAAFGGIRIEDDVVVAGGAAVTRNLTREVLPRGGGSV
jgi:Xaa-Pro dipeptidase